MDKEFIIAIELGSPKMTGIAGKKNLDGSITILAVAKEDSTLCIRKGVVYNIDKTTTALTNLVKKLKNNLKTEIAKVYVGIGGQSLRSIKTPSCASSLKRPSSHKIWSTLSSTRTAP